MTLRLHSTPFLFFCPSPLPFGEPPPAVCQRHKSAAIPTASRGRLLHSTPFHSNQFHDQPAPFSRQELHPLMIILLPSHHRISGSADQRISGSADQRISGSADHRISGSADHRISPSAHQPISPSADQRIIGSADQRICPAIIGSADQQSADQRINGSSDQRISGSADQRCSGSSDQRISGSCCPAIIGSADQRIIGSADPRIMRAIPPRHACMLRTHLHRLLRSQDRLSMPVHVHGLRLSDHPAFESRTASDIYGARSLVAWYRGFREE